MCVRAKEGNHKEKPKRDHMRSREEAHNKLNMVQTRKERVY